MVHTPLRLVQNEHPQVNEYKSDMSDYHHSKKCRHSPLTVLSHNSMKYLASNLLLRHQRLELGLPFPPPSPLGLWDLISEKYMYGNQQ